MHSSDDGSEGALKQFFDSILPKSTASAERNDEAQQLDWYQEHKRAIMVGIHCQCLWGICIGSCATYGTDGSDDVVYTLYWACGNNVKHRKAQNGAQQRMTAIRIELKQVYLVSFKARVKSKQGIHQHTPTLTLFLFPPPFFLLFVQHFSRIKNTPMLLV